ncbi:hypothetical protein AVEN_235549-1 [Araneus ventricosus]|uniref:Uncharacterized protein n=1 Tax=Araneus ventricosus TaxID=182803 RepID=A0A4Y2IT89_ARAVE|nr:hypothetical protein AVEN_235549-1 [Araneus ventricosus]
MNGSNQCLYTVTGSSLLVDRRRHKEGGSDLHEITIQDVARCRDDVTLLRRYSPPRVDTDTRVSTPISYSPCQNSGLSGAFSPRFSIPENWRVIDGSSSICVCPHVPVE